MKSRSKIARAFAPLFWLFAAVALAQSQPQAIPYEKYAKEVTSRISRVDEFRFMKQQADLLGIRVWVFGGTASAFGHYVRWDLQRESGDTSYQADRFDYNFSNIYRSTQDLDIVVDGSAEKAAALANLLRAKFPHMQGEKDAWEIRLLKAKNDDKEALLDNPDFLNQDTDSNSTGLIEITDPPPKEGRIRDLKNWSEPNSLFLTDLAEGKIHFLRSPKHHTTSRFKSGLNPEILAVVRYFTKALQYELPILDEDATVLQEIIDASTKKDLEESYVKSWIQKNGKKLFRNAIDVEYAWNTLDRFGLRQKLISFSEKTGEHSLAWWMDKEPLRSFTLGNGKKKTAQELGLKLLAHETSDFAAFESITMSRKGEPNVFISRDGVTGEAAAHGNGFYTRIGKEGARGTGYTIHFELHPDAREGTDFLYERGPKYVVVLNRAAIRVVPESLNFSPVDWFKLLAEGMQVLESNKGIYEKFRLRMERKIRNLSADEEKEIAALLKNELAKEDPSKFFLLEWSRTPIGRQYADLSGSDYLKIAEVQFTGDKHLNQDFHQEIVSLLKNKSYTVDEFNELCRAVYKSTAASTYSALPYLFLFSLPEAREKIDLAALFTHLAKLPNSFHDSEAERMIIETIDHRVANMQQDEIAAISKHTYALLGKNKSDYNVLYYFLMQTSGAPEKLLNALEWVELLAGNHLVRARKHNLSYFAEETAIHLNKSIAKASEKDKSAIKEIAKTALGDANAKGFRKVWFGLSISKELSEEPGHRLDFSKLSGHELFDLGNSDEVQMAAWKQAIEELKGTKLADFKRGFFYVSDFGAPMLHVDEKQKLVRLWVDRLLTDGNDDILKSLLYDFREPACADWGEEFHYFVTQAIAKKQRAILRAICDFFLYDQPHIDPWIRETDALIDAAFELNDKGMIKNLADHAFSIHDGKRRMNESALLKFIARAEEKSDLAALKGVMSVFKQGESVEAYLNAYQAMFQTVKRINDVSLFEEFIDNSGWSQDDPRKASARQPIFQEILDLAVKRRSRKILYAMRRQLGRVGVDDAFVLDYANVALKIGYDEVIGAVAESLFHGYDEKGVRTPDLLKKLVDIAYQTENPEMLAGIYQGSVAYGSHETHKYFIQVNRYFIERMLNLRMSKSALERAFGNRLQEALKKMARSSSSYGEKGWSALKSAYSEASAQKSLKKIAAAMGTKGKYPLPELPSAVCPPKLKKKKP